MSASTFLLILAGVVIVFVGFVLRSWGELSRTTRKGEKEKVEEEED